MESREREMQNDGLHAVLILRPVAAGCRFKLRWRLWAHRLELGKIFPQRTGVFPVVAGRDQIANMSTMGQRRVREPGTPKDVRLVYRWAQGQERREWLSDGGQDFDGDGILFARIQSGGNP